MDRREFVMLLGGASAYPLAARAQQSERMRQVGMLLSGTADDAVFQTWVGAFLQGLAQSGWVTGSPNENQKRLRLPRHRLRS